MTGQQPHQLDIEHWKLETRNGFRRLMGDIEPAPGIVTSATLQGRGIATAVTLAYFAYLWPIGEIDGGGVTLLFAPLISVGYVYAMHHRWRDIGVHHGWMVQTISLYVAYMLSDESGGFVTTYPVAQFVALAPAIYACLAPSAIGLPLQKLDDSKRLGRTGFILWVLPFLMLVAAHYWPGLDRVLSLAWNLIGSPAEHVALAATFWYLLLLAGPFAARANDAGWGQWSGAVIVALLAARLLAEFDLLGHRYATVPDLLVAVACLCLCFWPSRPVETPSDA